MTKFYIKYEENTPFVNTLNEKFKNNITYIDYCKLTEDRDPLSYLELKQIFKKNNIIIVNDLENIKNKYSNFKNIKL